MVVCNNGIYVEQHSQLEGARLASLVHLMSRYWTRTFCHYENYSEEAERG